MIKAFLSIRPLSSHFGLLILRLFVGAAMITHGYPKFLRILDGNFKFRDPLGIGSEASLILITFAEFICSILVILGLTTRFALIPLIIAMGVVFFIVHGADDFKSREIPFLFLGIYLTLFFTGPGKYSADRALFK